MYRWHYKETLTDEDCRAIERGVTIAQACHDKAYAADKPRKPVKKQTTLDSYFRTKRLDVLIIAQITFADSGAV